MDDSNGPNPSADAPDHGGSGLPESTITEDDMFEALAHERRRYLLYTLFEDDEWSLQTLSNKVAAWEDSCPVDDVPASKRERVYASLYHSHVPKLADLGIVEFDPSEEAIRKGPTAEQTLDVLEKTGASSADELERHARENDRFDG